MGSPRYPTQKQVRELNEVVDKRDVESLRLTKGTLKLELPVNGLALLEIANPKSR